MMYFWHSMMALKRNKCDDRNYRQVYVSGRICLLRLEEDEDVDIALLSPNRCSSIPPTVLKLFFLCFLGSERKLAFDFVATLAVELRVT